MVGGNVVIFVGGNVVIFGVMFGLQNPHVTKQSFLNCSHLFLSFFFSQKSNDSSSSITPSHSYKKQKIGDAPSFQVYENKKASFQYVVDLKKEKLVT